MLLNFFYGDVLNDRVDNFLFLLGAFGQVSVGRLPILECDVARIIIPY